MKDLACFLKSSLDILNAILKKVFMNLSLEYFLSLLMNISYALIKEELGVFIIE